MRIRVTVRVKVNITISLPGPERILLPEQPCLNDVDGLSCDILADHVKFAD